MEYILAVSADSKMFKVAGASLHRKDQDQGNKTSQIWWSIYNLKMLDIGIWCYSFCGLATLGLVALLASFAKLVLISSLKPL